MEKEAICPENALKVMKAVEEVVAPASNAAKKVTFQEIVLKQAVVKTVEVILVYH